jgi:integral membrane protein
MSAQRTPAAPAAPTRAEQRRSRAWRFYQVMAFVTGVMLLLLVAEMVLVYAVGVGPEVEAAIRWIPFAHGWIYVVYVAAVFNLWSVMRWGLGRMAALVLAGVVPVLSFVMEHRARDWVEADVRTGRGA